MKILEKIHSQALKIYSTFVLPNHIPQSKHYLLLLDMGIGNAVYMLPVIRALEKDCDTLTIYGNQKFQEVLTASGINFIPYRNNKIRLYTHIFANFLCQRNEDIGLILKHRIPVRIGHRWESRLKYSWAFNYLCDADESMHEIDSNARLLKPLLLSPIEKPLSVKSEKQYPKYDVLMQVHTSNDPKRNYRFYKDVIRKLHGLKIGMIGSCNEYDYTENVTEGTFAENLCKKYSVLDTCHLMQNAKVVVGNDSGLIKLSWAMGIPTIQIFTFSTVNHVRTRLPSGVNLIEPSIDSVVSTIKINL